MRIAFLINQYPKVSHTFIRREIAALERRGVQVERFAIRGWDAEVADPEDRAEQARTRYLLGGSGVALVAQALKRLVSHPVKGLRALLLACRMAGRSDRPLLVHVAYLLEGCRLADWLEGAGIDHVHAHFGTNSAEVAMLACELGSASYSFTVHGPEEFDKPHSLGLAEKIARARFVVAISSFGRGQLLRWCAPTDRPKIHVVHCGLEPAFFLPERDLRPAAHPKRLVCVGRLCEQKAQLLLVEAAGKLHRDGIDFELVFAGDGETRPELEALVASNGIGDKVRITGWIDSTQVREELLAARALVLPSFAEGLPVVIMESMALGRPVISTFVAGIPELVRPAVDGWLVPSGDVDALTCAMAQCLNASESVIATLGAAARKRAAERHDVDVEAGKLTSLLSAA